MNNTVEPQHVVRLKRSYWHSKIGLHCTTSLITMRRASTDELLEDEAKVIGVDEVFDQIINLDECEDGLYKVIVVNQSRDWETVDDYDFELVKVEG